MTAPRYVCRVCGQDRKNDGKRCRFCRCPKKPIKAPTLSEVRHKRESRRCP